MLEWSSFAGDLGTGKTTLVKGIAEGLEAASHEDVTSPTFTLIHEYRGPDMNLYHVDLYRIDTPRELDTLGLDELFAEDGNLVLLEWGEKFPRFEKERDVEISIDRRGDQERKFTVKPEVADHTWRAGYSASSSPSSCSKGKNTEKPFHCGRCDWCC